MAPRANWKGYLRLSLVSCPVALYPATTSAERVHFHRINKLTGHRLKQQNVDAETGEAVEREQVGRGYEAAKGHYVEVTDAEIEAIQVESTRTIDIGEFVPRAEIDDRYLNTPYYLAPDGKIGEEAFAVIRDTLASMQVVALGRVVLTRREHVIAIEARGKGLLGTTLRYPYEVRDEAPYVEGIPDVKLPKEMYDLAAHIVQTKRGHFDPSAFHDRYEEALVALLRSKQGGKPAPAFKPEEPARVINLMDALKRSLAAEAPAAALRPAKKSRKRIEGQREMLLPIKGGSEDGAVPDGAAKPRRRPSDKGRKAG